jgi:DNA-binding MarR family transcriptional regulator
MTPRSNDHDAVVREVWLLMGDLVLDYARRRAVSEELGMSFGRARALRRLARRSMSMSEFADAMDIDRPNATVIVDDLEAQGLVRRRPHPTDRRAKLVEVTRSGKDIARRADALLATPPPGFTKLSDEDLATLRAILERVRSET